MIVKNHLYTNTLGNFVRRAMSCGLIMEEDEDLGSEVELPLVSEVQPKETSLNFDSGNHVTELQEKSNR